MIFKSFLALQARRTIKARFYGHVLADTLDLADKTATMALRCLFTNSGNLNIENAFRGIVATKALIFKQKWQIFPLKHHFSS